MPARERVGFTTGRRASRPVCPIPWNGIWPWLTSRLATGRPPCQADPCRRSASPCRRANHSTRRTFPAWRKTSSCCIRIRVVAGNRLPQCRWRYFASGSHRARLFSSGARRKHMAPCLRTAWTCSTGPPCASSCGSCGAPPSSSAWTADPRTWQRHWINHSLPFTPGAIQDGWGHTGRTPGSGRAVGSCKCATSPHNRPPFLQPRRKS